MKRALKYLLPFLVFLTAFGVYVATLSPTISAGDSTEMVNAALVLGVPHQPSYPLNTLLGHAFSLLPIGDNPVWRVNLSTAFVQALSIMVVYLVLLKLILLFNQELQSDFSTRLLAASASLFLAFSLTYWQYGNRAEVFALNNLLIGLTLLSGLSAVIAKNRKYFYLTALLGGVAFSHHQTAVLLALPLFLLFVSSKKQLSLKLSSWVKAIFLFFLGLAPYFLVLITLSKRDPFLNWGEPNNFKDALRALVRADYGTVSAYLVGEGAGIAGKTAPLDQVQFYLSSLLNDFTIWGVILALLGAAFLLRRNRPIFNFILLGFMTGAAFLAYANFPLDNNFHQATTKRFQMVPDIFFVFFIFFGLWSLWQRLLDLKLDLRNRINWLSHLVILIVLFGLFLSVLFSNFAHADNRHNVITYEYARTILNETEPNAIIMLSGDIANFSARFVQTTGNQDNRIIFSPGQFHLEWMKRQLKRRYPDLIIPDPAPGKKYTSTSQIAFANLDKRPVYISPELAMYDAEVEKYFILWPKNLLFKVRRKGGEEKLENYREESQVLWESINLGWFSAIKANNPLMEDNIIDSYVRHFHNLGFMYDSVHLYDDAITEYNRVLQINPYFADSLKNLGIIYASKLEEKDPGLAVDYLGKFVSAAGVDRWEETDAARNLIYQIYAEENRKYASASAEASSSAEAKDAAPEEEKE